ncbi:hypothetical protein [Mesorhizobium sp. WSM2239]|uniref:DUF982 domain-containing protein n=2 Tax=unclassified Mesorhizobium TaxID=325217 RepID=A0AAU8D4D2_9HYPH
MWLRFTQDFDFSPAARSGHVTIAYRAGMRRNVTRECAEKAIAAGKAKRTIAPRQEAGNGEKAGCG